MKDELSTEKAPKIIKNIRQLIQQYFKENNLSYAIFGKSEGVDSSVIAGLLSNLEGLKPVGVIMPCESDPVAEHIARRVLDHFKIPKIRVDLTQEFHFLMGRLYATEGVYGQIADVFKHYDDSDLMKVLPHRKQRASGNIKARLRMTTLYHIAQLTGGIVISTDNLSELWTGFWTLNGDVGDLAPIQHIWKGLEEYAIAEALGVPEESLNAIPTDGLDVIPGGTDEDQLGLPYNELDRVIISLIQSKFDGSDKFSDNDIVSLSRHLSGQLGYDPDKIAHVAKQMMKTNFKRNWPRVFTRQELGLTNISAIKIQ